MMMIYRTYTPIVARFSAATLSVSFNACRTAREAICVYLFHLLHGQSGEASDRG